MWKALYCHELIHLLLLVFSYICSTLCFCEQEMWEGPDFITHDMFQAVAAMFDVDIVLLEATPLGMTTSQ